MRLRAAKKRVMTLESTLTRLKLDDTCRSGGLTNCDNFTFMEQLQELAREANRICERAEAAGDHRTALSGIRLGCDIIALMAALQGELGERTETNIVLNLDPDTARKMAETYLSRRNVLEGK